MTVPVLVTSSEGHFQAVLVGTPEVRGEGQSRSEAISALRSELLAQSREGELTWLDIDPPGVSGLAGSFADDPTLRDLCADIYSQRDAELHQ